MARRRSTRMSKESCITGAEVKECTIGSSEKVLKKYFKKKAGKLTPLEQFISDNIRTVCILAYKYANHRSTKDDLISAGIERLIKIFPKYNPRTTSSSGVWVQRSLRQGIMVYLRKNRSELSTPCNPNGSNHYKWACDPTNSVSIDSLENSDCCSFAIELDEPVIDYFDKRRLARAISLLQPQEQEAVNLFYYKGLQHPEIDKILGRVGATEYRLMMARKKIKKYFEQRNVRLEL